MGYPPDPKRYPKGPNPEAAPFKDVHRHGLLGGGPRRALRRAHVLVQALGVAQQLRHVKELREPSVRLRQGLYSLQERLPPLVVACVLKPRGFGFSIGV